MSRARHRSEAALPSYLAGTLRFRGRIRLSWTAILVVLLVILGGPVQSSLGHTTNAPVVLVVLLLAWMWGRVPGAVLAVVGTLGNYQWGVAAGLDHPSFGSVIVDAVAVAAVAFLIGHIGLYLENALGARARSDRAFSELEQVARDRMLTITDEIPVGLYRTTSDGRIIGGNDALMNILGYSNREAMLNSNVWTHYAHTEVRELKLDASRRRDETWTEFELRRSDDSHLWVRDWSRAVPGPDGKVEYYDGVLEDISEQHEAGERFRAAFDDSPYGMAIASPDGYVVRANPAFADMVGRPLDELANIHFSEATFSDEAHLSTDGIGRVVAGEVARYEKRLRRPDGSYIWALVSLAPIHGGGNQKLFIAHVIDITERRIAREALEELVQSKDELIASVSHELRTPLTVVLGLAEELNRNWVSFSVPEQKEFIGLIHQQSAEVAHIVEDLLVAARADIGKLPIHAARVDIRDQLESAFVAVPELAVTVESAGNEAPVAFADATRVRQIVRNLLVNAKRYGGPNVRACYGSDRESVWLEILDDGEGIPEDAVVDVFEPYSRAHNAAGQPSSVGLGLTVSRKLAVLMGGTLDYRNESGWSCFRLALPRAGSVRTGGLPVPPTVDDAN